MDRSAGKVTFCGILFVLVLGIGIYVGYLYGKMYYGRGQMEEVVRTASFSPTRDTEEYIRRKILAAASDAGVPLREQDIRVARQERRWRVEVSWHVTLNLFGFFPLKHDFKLVEGEGVKP